MTSRLLVLFIYLIPYEAAAIMALEIKPQDVYQAGYCEAFVEGALSASTEQIPAEAANTVRLKANDLISGGDNLSFVPIGEQAARTDLIEILGVKGGERTLGLLPPKLKIVRRFSLKLLIAIKVIPVGTGETGTSQKLIC
jgi:hypothetical protein